MKNKIFAVLGLLLFLFVSYWGIKKYIGYKTKKNQEVEATVLMEKVKTVAKLVTVEGYFSEVYDYKDSWGYNWSPFTKKALIRVKAKVSIGYDMADIKVETNAAERVMIISNLPDPQIISIDHDQDYYDISEGTFNSFSEKDYNKMNKDVKDKIRQQALASDLFLAAEKQSNQMLELIQFIAESSGWRIEYKLRNEAIEMLNGEAIDSLIGF